MKLAFAHDHLFQIDEKGQFYTGGSFNNEAWKRYLNHFDEVTVLARLEKLRNECDYDCMYCNKTLQQYCCEKSEKSTESLTLLRKISVTLPLL